MVGEKEKKKREAFSTVAFFQQEFQILTELLVDARKCAFSRSLLYSRGEVLCGRWKHFF